MPESPSFVVNIIKMFWTPGKKILEIGCGPAFLRKIFGKDYTGTDITDSNYGENLARDVDIVCSAENLLLENNSIDIIVIKSAFFLFPDHEAALKESLRVLKNDGKLLIFDYNRRTQKKLQKKENHNNYPCWTQLELKKFIKKNGFKDVKTILAEDTQPHGLKKYYKLIRNELHGDWAIVCGTK